MNKFSVMSLSLFVLSMSACQAPLQTTSQPDTIQNSVSQTDVQSKQGLSPTAQTIRVVEVSQSVSQPAKNSQLPQAVFKPDLITLENTNSVTAPPQGVTAPPQGLTASEQAQNITAPPQGITAPPQGITAPPLGVNQPLEQSQFDFYDSNDDQYWNTQELAVYRQDWNAANQGFATQSLLGDLLSLDLNQLLTSFDADHDNLLNFSEAQALHTGLGQAATGLTKTLGQTVNGAVSTVTGVLNPVLQPVGQLLGSNPTPSSSAATSSGSSGLLGAVTGVVSSTVGSLTGQPSASPSPSQSGGGLLGKLLGK